MPLDRTTGVLSCDYNYAIVYYRIKSNPDRDPQSKRIGIFDLCSTLRLYRIIAKRFILHHRNNHILILEVLKRICQQLFLKWNLLSMSFMR